MSNKIRNRAIALACLLAFIGLGILFYVNWVVQKPFAIILFLTDNLTTSTLTAARIYQNGADNRLNLDHPVWVEDKDFDVDRHLHRIGLPAPGALRPCIITRKR